VDINVRDISIEREREIMLFIGKPMGRSIMISNVNILIHKIINVRTINVA